MKDKTLVILKAGDPVPSVAAKRGSFFKLIEESIGGEWPGGYTEFDARKGPFPSPGDAAAVVITGSASNVPSREGWMLRTEGWLREVVASHVPTFGICFGHQILAQALGGEVIKNPRGREIGTCRVERFVDDPIFDGLPTTFEANVTHIDTVSRLPAGAVSLARSSQEDNHAIRFSDTCYGVQFHPEIDADVMRGYIASRREILASEGFDVHAMVAAITDGDAGRRTLQNFIRHIVLVSLAGD